MKIQFKNIILIMFILLSLVNLNYAEDINSYDYLKLKITNNIGFDINFDDKYNIEQFEVSSYFLPISYEDSQALNNFQSSHTNYKIINESGNIFLKFYYDKSTLKNKNKIENLFIIESTRFEPEIKNKIKYPLTNIKEEDKIYLNFGGLIDIDEKIRTQASALAAEEDDTYLIAAKIAKWIREDITYDLSTVTKNPNQKSTNVFESKTGVCKEISNLFISMMRSLGIPARVVTGYAYTNSDEVIAYTGSNWGGHAWTEVLIGDTWVPFDMTYNQYGYVDASHIILDKSVHIRNNSVLINSYGYGYKFVGASKIESDFEIVDKLKINQQKRFDIKLEGPDKLGFGSYGYIKVKVKNTQDKYNILFLTISKAKEVELLDLDKQMEIFMPNEEKEIYFRYKLTDDLDPNYKFTFPFKIYNQDIEEDFNVEVESDYLAIKQIALPQKEEKETELSQNGLNFDCNYILDYPNNIILCTVQNPNNFEINNINVCLGTIQDNCEKLDLKLNEMKSINFETKKFEETINYYYNYKQESLSLKLDKPKLKLNYKLTNQSLIINYTIENFGQNLVVNIYQDEQVFMKLDKEYSKLQIPLNYGNNSIKISLDLGNYTFDEKAFELTVEEPKKSFIDKILIWILGLF